MAARAALEAGTLIRAAHDRRELGIAEFRRKGPIDLVTEVDLAAEAAVREVLAREQPGVPVLAEEGGGARQAATRWIVDPLDGTTNFVHGFPAFAVSLALQVDGALVAACTYDPLRDELYAAAPGTGAWMDDRRLRVSSTPTLADSLLLTGFPYDRRERAEYYLRFVRAAIEATQGIRRAGAASLDFAHVAAGRADGFWEFGLRPWDVAAGSLLVEEAGGRVTDMEGGPLDLDRPRLLATNGLIHEALSQMLRSLLSSAVQSAGA